MKPFRKILVPVDFSTHSVEAVRYAADLGFKHAILGSVAEKVVRTAPCPVLTIRAVART